MADVDYRTLKLAQLLPPNIASDKQIQAAASAVDDRFARLIAQADKLDKFGRIHEWTSEETDELAWEFHVDFYDASAPLEQRRQLVGTSMTLHREKGTQAAVERLVTLLFGYGRVENWYEYSGQPGYFQVITNNPAVTEEMAADFLRAVDSVKRESAHLERVVIEKVATSNYYCGTVTHLFDKLTIMGRLD